MKSIYRIFTKVSFLSIITILMLLFTLQFLSFGIINIFERGIGYYLTENFIDIIIFSIILVFDIWLLTSTFLPIIKINGDGIFAYSIFWRRSIKWTEIKSAKPLQLGFAREWATVEFTKEPENKKSRTVGGLRKVVLIIISKKSFRKPPCITFRWGLFNHRKIATIDEIAFKYDKKAWEVIQNKLNG